MCDAELSAEAYRRGATVAQMQVAGGETERSWDRCEPTAAVHETSLPCLLTLCRQNNNAGTRCFIQSQTYLHEQL